MKLEIGDDAPDFELESDEGNLVKLSDFRGQRVLIFFYPKANTSGCTKQACGFRDNFPQITSAGAAVFGISPDSVAKLSDWRSKENFPYNLLSDPGHAVADLYGVWGEKKMYGKSYEGIIRSHFVIDANGRLEDVRYKVSPQKSIDLGVRQLTSA